MAYKNNDLSGIVDMIGDQTKPGRDMFTRINGEVGSLLSMGAGSPTSSTYTHNGSSKESAKLDGISNTLCYPADLGSDRNQHFVQFEIFIVNSGATYEEAKTENKIVDGAKPRFTQSNQANAKTASQVVSQVEFTANFVKLQEMIGLPVPESVLSDNSTIWSRADGGMAAGAVSFADAMYTEDGRAKHEVMKNLGLGMSSTVAGLLENMGADGAQTVLKAGTKRQSNPRSEFLFDGVGSRSFTFNWRLIPKSQVEFETMFSIMERFKFYMYPELDEALNGSFYIFPALFDITFMSGNDENKYLYKTSSCALTSCLINYTPAGQWVAMEGTNAPFGIELTLQFTEVEFLHRKRFKDGHVR